MQRGFARKRGTFWTAYFYTTDARGRRQRTKSGFRTKAEAQAFLTSTMATLQKNELVETIKITFGEYLTERWLPIMERSIRPSTHDSYTRMISNHVLPRLGHVKLQALTANHLDELY